MPLVTLNVDGNIGVIIVDNPPVNALNNGMRARPDRGVGARRAAMRRSKAWCWPARAAPSSPAPTSPNSTSRPKSDRHHRRDRGDRRDAANRWSPRCIGTPLGGGLEVALGCHFRIAAPGTRLGAAGNQARPDAGRRRHPATAAAGRHGQGDGDDPVRRSDRPPTDARACGLVDEIAAGDLAAAAVAFARRMIDRKASPALRATARTSSPPCGPTRRNSTSSPRQVLPSASRGQHAPASARSRHCAGRSTCRSTRR